MTVPLHEAGDASFTELTGERVILRRFRRADLATFVAYRCDPAIARYQGWEAPYPEADGQRLIESMLAQHPDTPGMWYQYATALKATGELIGDCGCCADSGDARLAEVGYTIASRYQGRGYGREAVRLLLTYLFEDRGKHRVTARCDPRNTASVKLLRSLGLRQEGHLRESSWEHGEWADDLLFAMLASEWQALPRPAQGRDQR